DDIPDLLPLKGEKERRHRAHLTCDIWKHMVVNIRDSRKDPAPRILERDTDELEPRHEEKRMFTHVMVGANDLAASKKFYDAVLGVLGMAEGQADPKGRIFWRSKSGVFGITKPIDGNAATCANGGTIGLGCASPEMVKAFHD